MRKSSVKTLVLAALFLAMALVLLLWLALGIGSWSDRPCSPLSDVRYAAHVPHGGMHGL